MGFLRMTATSFERLLDRLFDKRLFERPWFLGLGFFRDVDVKVGDFDFAFGVGNALVVELPHA